MGAITMIHYAKLGPDGQVLSFASPQTANAEALEALLLASADHVILTEAQFEAVRGAYITGETHNRVLLNPQGDIALVESCLPAADLKWQDIKSSRDTALTAPLPTPYGTFDATPQAQTNILKSCQLASTMISMGQTGTIDFTLADNTTVSLTYPQMVEVGLLLGQREQATRAHATNLRNQIYATGADLSLINW